MKGKEHRGQLEITPWRIVLRETEESGHSVSVPLACIERWSVKDHTVLLKTRDVRELELRWTPDDDKARQRVTAYLEMQCFCEPRGLFACQGPKTKVPTEEVSLARGYEAMKATAGGQFRSTLINKGYAVCTSYPEELMVANVLDDAAYVQVAQYRSKGRLPVLSWCKEGGAELGGCLLRCAQPRTGISRHTSRWDEELVTKLGHPPLPVVSILDARPKANAVANQARGGGSEVMRGYPRAEIYFADIENIHVMRKDGAALDELCCALEVGSSGVWFKTLQVWLDHIGNLLDAANRCAMDMDRGRCVLLHCR
jgi:hypothetical protein